MFALVVPSAYKRCPLAHLSVYINSTPPWLFEWNLILVIFFLTICWQIPILFQIGQKYLALYRRPKHVDITGSSKNYFVDYNNETGIYGCMSLATVNSVLLFLLLNVKYIAQQYTQKVLVHFHGHSQQCFMVFVTELKTRSSTINTKHTVAFQWLQWLNECSTVLHHTCTA